MNARHARQEIGMSGDERRAMGWGRVGIRSVVGAILASAAFMACGGDPDAGMPDHVKQRHLALDGAPNFRDLGGYATADGRHVRWGQFYRSDDLAALTDEDLEKVSALGLKLVCDFRSESEKQSEPDRRPRSPTSPSVPRRSWSRIFASESARATSRTSTSAA
jgi:hypothetical protein